MEPLDHFLETFSQIDGENLDLLGEIYAPDIHFIDPVHEVRGIGELEHYFSSLYKSVESLNFNFRHSLCQDTEAYVSWVMTFSHPRIGGGRTIELPGVSRLTFNGEQKVRRHHDYFDLGAMLYEHLPIIGSVTKTIKRRLGQ